MPQSFCFENPLYMKKCVKFWSFLLIVLLCTYWEQCSTTKTNARSLRKMNLPAVILVLLLCITFSGSQKASKPQSNKKCKREVYPKSWTEGAGFGGLKTQASAFTPAEEVLGLSVVIGMETARIILSHSDPYT
ncbi:uncharacterized protein LOC119399671 isoform X4 [Rhipicephalus sanguineus]|uniref:uncharacterized protein LOC119399671 isoform X4 n=1 Tax=Rhipicephalus sanguineus TaxID=34632 RepID=UPI0018957A2F|nr:uncharacterized protein LOC119399671 isoform X4 [Rhipicephalus sanguineus]